MNIKSKLAAVTLGISLAPASLYVSDIAISNAVADSANKDINVSANVPAVCNFATGFVDIDFGSYDPTGANASDGADLDGAGSFKVRCTKGTAYTLTMDAGDHGTADATNPTRNMDNSGVNLNYQLYTDSGRTTVWSTDAANDVSGTATSASPMTIDVYGRVPKGQDTVSAGSYTDAVNIVVNY